MQTSSVCLRRQLPRRGKPGKGELCRALLQRGKPRKERKTAEALERAKRGKGWWGGWLQTSSVCLRRQLPRRGSREKANCADSFPEGGSRERANCAEGFYREKNRERTKDSRSVGKVKAGKRLVRRLEQTFSVCLRRQLPRRQSREGQERFRGVRA